MVPPWVPDVESPIAGGGALDAEQQDGIITSPASSAPSAAVIPENPIAPAGRFGNARRSLGEFGRSGNSGAMRRGVGRYIQGGYGGRGTATRRFGGTARTADALYSALGGTSGGAGTSSALPQTAAPQDVVLTNSRSADDVMDAVVEAIRPVDGTQDGEASRAAIKDALSELLTKFPEADLLSLDEAQREFAIERYVAADVFRRFDLDVGQSIKDKAPTAKIALARLKEVRDYIKETVSAAFRGLRSAGQKLAGGKIANIVRSALDETFKVFEGYAE
ncbi:MAG TPA: Qat anti-phage system associated protein QatB [Oculatellaceae cyanobacterium]